LSLASEFPPHRAPAPDIVDLAPPMQPLHDIPDLIADRAAQDAVGGIEALGGDHSARNVIGAQQLARCDPQHAKAKPRQLIPGEVAIAAIDTFCFYLLRVQIAGENAQHAIDMRQIGSMLVKGCALRLESGASTTKES
jgi:hypothetical protein